MKKYLGLFVVLLMVSMVNVQTLRAEDGDDNTEKEWKTEMKAKREELKQKMEALRAKIKEERDATKAKIKELRIVGREKAMERFDKAVERINNLQDKINSKITNLKAKGVITINAESLMTTSETKLSDAKKKIAEINALLVTSINELSLENKTKLRTLTKEAQALIIEAHKALKDAVKSLKDSVKSLRDSLKIKSDDDAGENENN